MSPLSPVIRAFRQQPFITGVAFAGSKGALADLVSQSLLQDGDYKPSRTLAFGLWNALYCGAVVYALYSVLLPRVLPLVLASGARHPRAALHTVLSVGFDNFLATPFLCLPTYYFCHTAVEASWQERRRPLELASNSLQLYASEAYETLLLSWSLWIPIHFATFTVIPPPLRAHWSAACSFVTLTFMSLLQSTLERRRPSIARLRGGAAVSQAMHKMSARANRMAVLLQRQNALTAAEAKELAGLQSLETYDESVFTEAHAQFKASHNAMFIDLHRYAGGGPCFYLDGPGGGTTSALLAADGFSSADLFSANWHPSTAEALRQLLPETQVACGSADEALSSPTIFGRQPFASVYVDGCGGAPAPVVACVEALFAPDRAVINPPTIAFGFTLTSAEPTGTPLSDREVQVQRSLAAACRRAGYAMAHVADEPARYGADPATRKREGNTLTTWHVCERREN